MFISELFIMSKTWKQPKFPSIHECVKKSKYIHNIVVVQSPSRVQLFATSWTAARQASCPSPSPGVCPSSCSLQGGCCPTISSSEAVFSLSVCNITQSQKGWSLAICNNNIDGRSGYYNKWNKLEKNKHCIISLICGLQSTKQINITQQRWTHRHREQFGGC